MGDAAAAVVVLTNGSAYCCMEERGYELVGRIRTGRARGEEQEETRLCWAWPGSHTGSETVETARWDRFFCGRGNWHR